MINRSRNVLNILKHLFTSLSEFGQGYRERILDFSRKYCSCRSGIFSKHLKHFFGQWYSIFVVQQNCIVSLFKKIQMPELLLPDFISITLERFYAAGLFSSNMWPGRTTTALECWIQEERNYIRFVNHCISSILPSQLNIVNQMKDEINVLLVYFTCTFALHQFLLWSWKTMHIL